MELPICLFEGLLHPHDPFHMGIQLNFALIHCRGVAYQPQDGTSHAVGDTDLQALMFQLANQFINIFFLRTRTHDNNHFKSLL